MLGVARSAVKMINHEAKTRSQREKGRAHKGKINIHKLKLSWVEKI